MHHVLGVAVFVLAVYRSSACGARVSWCTACVTRTRGALCWLGEEHVMFSFFSRIKKDSVAASTCSIRLDLGA